jgi:uncharacterized protein
MQPTPPIASAPTQHQAGPASNPLQSRDAQPPSLPIVGQQFRTVIMQPATLCNLDCAYCYLPGRSRQTLMPARVADRVAASVTDQGSGFPVEVVWHGGEALTTPRAHMQTLLDSFESLRRNGHVVHAVQTNATLIDASWISLLAEYDIQVGVSIDGPSWLNTVRVDRGGRPSFARTMSGIRALREAGIAFTAICVVTVDGIEHADALLEFFAELGCTVVGFNIEEQEGLNAHRRQVTPEQAQEFWHRLWQLSPQYPQLRIRDLDRFRGYLDYARSGQPTQPVVYDPIPTVAATGQTVLLSPELLGVTAPAYHDFVIGNVLSRSLPDLITAHQHGYVSEFTAGLRRCAAECEFWDFCHGAQAGNRYFEHGRFDVTKTNYCATTYQAVVRAALDLIQGDAR